jgi:uncharacterized membrane protein YfcA
MSWLLLALGCILLARFGFGVRLVPALSGRPTSKLLIPLGAFAGFVDSSGGGGWGPITTPTLLSTTQTMPRTVIGTVSASEFLVAAAASAGFIAGSATSGLDWKVISGLLLGGVLMAPFAAMLAGRIPHAPFGALIGGVVLVTNTRTILTAGNFATRTIVMVLVVESLLSLALAYKASVREHKLGVERSLFETRDQ